MQYHCLNNLYRIGKLCKVIMSNPLLSHCPTLFYVCFVTWLRLAITNTPIKFDSRLQQHDCLCHRPLIHQLTIKDTSSNCHCSIYPYICRCTNNPHTCNYTNNPPKKRQIKASNYDANEMNKPHPIIKVSVLKLQRCIKHGLALPSQNMPGLADSSFQLAHGLALLGWNMPGLADSGQPYGLSLGPLIGQTRTLLQPSTWN